MTEQREISVLISFDSLCNEGAECNARRKSETTREPIIPHENTYNAGVKFQPGQTAMFSR